MSQDLSQKNVKRMKFNGKVEKEEIKETELQNVVNAEPAKEEPKEEKKKKVVKGKATPGRKKNPS